MDNHSETYISEGKYPRRFFARLLIFRGLILRLASLVSVTQRDLMEAGVYLRRTRD